MPVGHSHVWGVPLACLGCFLPAWHDEGPGCRCGSGLLSSGAGSARCVSRLWCAERALGRPEGGAGETGGNPGLWGGLPRVSPAMLAGFPVRQAQRGIRRPRGARHPRPLPRPWVLAGTGVRPAFHGHWCGGCLVCQDGPLPLPVAGSGVTLGGATRAGSSPLSWSRRPARVFVDLLPAAIATKTDERS